MLIALLAVLGVDLIVLVEAFEHGGKLVGIMTTLGFAVAFTIHTLG